MVWPWCLVTWPHLSSFDTIILISWWITLCVMITFHDGSDRVLVEPHPKLDAWESFVTPVITLLMEKALVPQPPACRKGYLTLSPIPFLNLSIEYSSQKVPVKIGDWWLDRSIGSCSYCVQMRWYICVNIPCMQNLLPLIQVHWYEMLKRPLFAHLRDWQVRERVNRQWIPRSLFCWLQGVGSQVPLFDDQVFIEGAKGSRESIESFVLGLNIYCETICWHLFGLA